MTKIFGTDGLRGTANCGVMTAETALKLGMAAGSIFTRGNHRHRVIIGKDTRLSGYLFEQALTAGFIAVGMDVILIGPMPTPAVAMLTKTLRADIGVMVSASHNPYYDNGIKLFGPDGFKLSDLVENQIEFAMNQTEKFLAKPELLGKAKRLDDAAGRYTEFVKNTFPRGKTLEGLKVVIDCANGASYHLAGNILWELGAEVIELANHPDGFNINENCGSTHPQNLALEVIKQQAHIGIALDGDADRVVLVDELGNVIDGDQIMAMIAHYYHQQQRLSSKNIVSTIMSNLGFEDFLNNLDLKLVRTQVGDRYVTEAMRKFGANLGGEQSGHIILSDYTTTGDGLIAALQILAIMVGNSQPMSSLSKMFEPWPQILRNVKINNDNILDNMSVRLAINEAEKKLLNNGRLLIRKSGTEPLIRIMAECRDAELLGKIINDIVFEMEKK